MKKGMIIVFLALVGLSMIFYLNQVNFTGAQTPDVTVSKVNGTVTVDGKADEAFWANAPAKTFTLTATPGATLEIASVSIKVVYTDTEIVFYAVWADNSRSNNRSVTAEDRIAIMFAMGENPMDAPCMNSSTNGATTSGSADQWHWKASRLDSEGAEYNAVARNGIAYNLANTSTIISGKNVPAESAVYTATGYGSEWNVTQQGGTTGDVVYYYPSNMTLTIAGKPGAIKLNLTAHPYSFADNEYLNTTARYRSGDSEYTKFGLSAGPLSPYARYDVKAKGFHNGTHWGVEFARKLTPTNSNIDLAFAPGDSIKISIAVYEGGKTQDREKKQFTAGWKTITLEDAAIPGLPIEWIFGISIITVIAMLRKRKN